MSFTEKEFYEFAKQVEADLVAHDPAWAEPPFGTEAGLIGQYDQTFDGVGTIFYYTVDQSPEGLYFRNTYLLEMSRPDLVDPGDGIDLYPIQEPGASSLVFYGPQAPEAPALSPIWFDTLTGDIRIWYSYDGNETWVNTGVAGVGKIEFLNDLFDVDVMTTPPADTNHLEFNAGENRWKVVDLYAYISANYSPIAHTHQLADLTDTTIDTPELDQVLSYSGSAWVNKSVKSVEVWYGATPPTDILKYPIWFNTTSAFTAIYYDDGNSQQWVSIGGTDSRVETVTSNAHAFNGRVAADYTEGIGLSLVLFDTSAPNGFDTDGDYNNVLHRYVAPVDGIYEFNCNMRIDNLSHSSYIYLYLYKNLTPINYVIEGNTESTNYMNIGFATNVEAVAGYYFSVYKN